MSLVFRLFGSPYVIPAIAGMVVVLVVTARMIDELQIGYSGFRRDVPSTTTCEECGKLSILIEPTKWRCAFCRHEQGSGTRHPASR